MSRLPVRRLLAVGALVGGLLLWSELRPYDPAPWLADFVALRDSMAAGYANLDWKVTRGGVDAAGLTRSTDSAIRAAGSDRKARRALQQFVDAFGDGHLDLRRPRPTLEAIERRVRQGFSTGPLTADLDAPAACSRLGLSTDDTPPLLAAGPGYVPLDADANAFQAGTLVLEPAGTVGVVRISLFSSEAYRPACERVWPEFRTQLLPGEPCDGECEDRLRAALDARLTVELGARIAALQAAGSRAIVVDLTGNGGGRDWVDQAARVVTSRTLRSPRVSFVRHAHWVPTFERDLAAVDRDLARTDLDSLRRALLEDARERFALALDEARTPCDVRPIWDSGLPGPDCRNIGSAELYASGAYGWLAPGTVGGLGSAEALFWPGARGAARGVGTVPLLVLVDRRTASASEYFAAMLRDNGAARIIGERTYGAGCGYTNGGIPVTLPHSGLRLRMPDCLRLRADGTNEVAGITPDVPVEWTDEDDDAARAVKARAALERLDLMAGPAPQRAAVRTPR